MADAQAQSNPASLCLALAWTGCRVSLWLGDLESAERSVALLKEQAGQHGLTTYYACGVGFEGTLGAKRGDVAGGERLARACLDGLYAASWSIGYTIFRSMHAEILIAAGDADAATAAAEDAAERTEAHGVLWWMPEALRIEGEALLLSGTTNQAEAEKHFRRSLDLARRQGALSWELRTATSLALLLRASDRQREGRELLSSVYGRFTEGFETTDLKAASRILIELDQALLPHGTGAGVSTVLGASLGPIAAAPANKGPATSTLRRVRSNAREVGPPGAHCGTEVKQALP